MKSDKAAFGDREPAQMREDAQMWERAGYSPVAVGRYRDAADQLERLIEYADHLAAGFPEGMLPKDVENLREANALLASEVHELRQALADAARPEASEFWVPRSYHESVVESVKSSARAKGD